MTEHKAAVYVRISQDREGAGLGIERQTNDCHALAEHLGWSVIDVYSDNDISAYSGKPRPAYHRMLNDIETGRVTAVLAWHTDRLHRSPAELERYIAVCDPRGVPTHTVKAGQLDLSTATGRMTARITGAVARHESEQKGDRVRAQKQQALQQGRRIGGRRPFGYEDNGYDLRHEEADLMADAARRIVAGDSIRAITREWNDAGVPTAGGHQWTPANLRAMLLKPRNAGLSASKGRIIGEARWPAAIDPDTWHALRALLTDPERRTNRRGVSRVLVGSFLYLCGRCGRHVTSGGLGSNGQRRYTCPTMHLVRSAAAVDAYVYGTVEGLLAREGVGLIPQRDEVAPLREKLAALQVRSQELADMFGDPAGTMTADQFTRANGRLQAEITQLQAEIGRNTADSSLAGIADATDPVAAFRAADIDRQRVVIGALMDVILMPMGRGRPSTFDPTTVWLVDRAGTVH